MSDYLGALQRLATAPASSGKSFDLGARPTGQRVPPAARAGSDESVRDGAFELETSAAVPAGQWAGAMGSMLREGLANTDGRASAPATTNPTSEVVHGSVAPGPTQTAAAQARRRTEIPTGARNGIDSAVHPALQAALRWVAGDPQHGALSDARANAVTPHARPDSARALSDQAAPPERSRALAALIPHSTQPSLGAPSQATSPVAQDFALDLDLPAGPRPLRARASRARADRASDAAAASTQPDRVEISIGSIHVSVDAPVALRSVALPAPAPQRQVPTQATAQAAAHATAHSAFSRSRLPRR